MNGNSGNSLFQRSIDRRAFLKAAGATVGMMALGPFLSGCGPEQVATGRKDLNVALFGEPATLFPIVRTGLQGSQVVSNVYNRLLNYDPETQQVIPEIVEEWELRDPVTWVFKLREGVQFHKDYGELTSEDIAHYTNYIIDTKSYLLGSSFFAMDYAEATDKYVVTFHLQKPQSNFLTRTCNYAYKAISKKALDELGEEEYGRNPVGTGPFWLESWTSGSHMVLKKHEGYWAKDRPYLDEVTMRFVPDPSVRMAMLQKEEIDFMDHPDPKDVAALREAEEYVVTSTPGWNWDYIHFNFLPEVGDLPTKKKEVRQAISYAINRKAIVEAIYGGEAVVSDSPLVPGFVASRPVPIKYPAEGDLEKAKALLAQAGYADGFEIECITSDKDWLRRELEVIADQLRKVNITVKIQGLDIGTYNERHLKSMDWEMVFEDITIVSPDPDSAMFAFLDSKGNAAAGYANDRMDTRLEEGQQTVDEEKQVELYGEALDIVLEECPYIYLSHVNYLRAFRKGLVGFTPSPQESELAFGDVHWEA